MRPVTFSDVAWARAFHDWLADFNASKTRRAYHDAWRDFLAWHGGHAPQAISAADVTAYRQHLATTPRRKTGKPYSASSINQQLAALSSFFQFAITRGLTAHNPAGSVRRRPVSPYGKAVWLHGETGQDVQLLKHIDTHSEQGRRDFALFLLFLTSALRVGAVASLRLENVRQQGDDLYIRYTEKGGEEAEKLLEPVTASALRLYLAGRGTLTPESPLFAPTRRGQRAIANLPHTDITARAGEKPLSIGAINKLLRAYCDRVFGKGHGITPHALRHTAARNAALGGATLSEISQLLAHKSPAITLIYLHATDKSGDKVSRQLGKRYETMGDGGDS